MNELDRLEAGAAASRKVIQDEERRQAERRQPKAFIDLPWEQGLDYIAQKKYTGMFFVCHASEGAPKRIVLPNPAGW